MRVSVTLRTADGAQHQLGHGDLVGRLWSAALYIDDPRISEAHAMVSLRGDALRLLALRGRLAVDGQFVEQVRLEPGVVVRLSPEVTVEVVSTTLPVEVLALEAEGLGRRILHGTCGLIGGPTPDLVPAGAPRAQVLVWQGADGWRYRHEGGATRRLLPGDAIEVGGTIFTAVEVPLAATAPTRTERGPAPLRVVARYDTVHVQQEGHPTRVIAGVPARLISELVRFGTPVPWAMLAGELWPEPGVDPSVQRRRLDAALWRLRSRLHDLGIRTDLVRPTGVGQVEVFLQHGDTVEDRT